MKNGSCSQCFILTPSFTKRRPLPLSAANSWSRRSLWSYSLSEAPINLTGLSWRKDNIHLIISPIKGYTVYWKAYRMYHTTAWTFTSFQLYPNVICTAYMKKRSSKLSQNGWTSISDHFSIHSQSLKGCSGASVLRYLVLGRHLPHIAVRFENHSTGTTIVCESAQHIDYRCEDGRFPVSASCVTISNLA